MRVAGIAGTVELTGISNLDAQAFFKFCFCKVLMSRRNGCHERHLNLLAEPIRTLHAVKSVKRKATKKCALNLKVSAIMKNNMDRDVSQGLFITE